MPKQKNVRGKSEEGRGKRGKEKGRGKRIEPIVFRPKLALIITRFSLQRSIISEYSTFFKLCRIIVIIIN